MNDQGQKKFLVCVTKSKNCTVILGKNTKKLYATIPDTCGIDRGGGAILLAYVSGIPNMVLNQGHVFFIGLDYAFCS